MTPNVAAHQASLQGPKPNRSRPTEASRLRPFADVEMSTDGWTATRGDLGAAAVLDVDCERMPSEILALDGYSGALALIRWRGIPVGQAWLRVREGRISGEELDAAITEEIGWAVFERWIEQVLKSRPDVVSRLPTATVAICTRDRTDDLRRCLDGVIRQAHKPQEILIVDNCPSSEETRSLVQAYPNVRYVREERPGLNRARNRALEEARCDIVAFTDDDAVPDPMWLLRLLQSFDDPLVLCATGLTMPLEQLTEAQRRFERYVPFGKGFYRRVFHSTLHDPLTVSVVGAGANMAVRRDLAARVGPFDPALDAGTPTRSGGDHEMFSRILIRGYKIVYDPAALSWHRHRRTWAELRSAIHGYGVGVYAMWTRMLLIEREFGVIRHAANWIRLAQARQLMRSLLNRPDSVPLDLVLAELRGCLEGPLAYIASRRNAERPKQ